MHAGMNGYRVWSTYMYMYILCIYNRKDLLRVCGGYSFLFYVCFSCIFHQEIAHLARKLST